MTVRFSIKYRRGYKYQLDEPAEIETPIRPGRDIATPYISLSAEGKLWIRDGYAWDGSSGPAIDTRASMPASVVHDALYQLMRLGHLDAKWKDAADALYHDLCLEGGSFRPLAWWRLKALSLFGDGSTRPSAEPPVLRAP